DYAAAADVQVVRQRHTRAGAQRSAVQLDQASAKGAVVVGDDRAAVDVGSTAVRIGGVQHDRAHAVLNDQSASSDGRGAEIGSLRHHVAAVEDQRAVVDDRAGGGD